MVVYIKFDLMLQNQVERLKDLISSKKKQRQAFSWAVSFSKPLSLPPHLSSWSMCQNPQHTCSPVQSMAFWEKAMMPD